MSVSIYLIGSARSVAPRKEGEVQDMQNNPAAQRMAMIPVTVVSAVAAGALAPPAGEAFRATNGQEDR
jgi:hypothetical protein